MTQVSKVIFLCWQAKTCTAGRSEGPGVGQPSNFGNGSIWLHPGREIMLCGSGQIWTGIESYKIVFCKLELAKLAEDLLKAIRWSKSQAQSRTTD
jgi:hypothetical protein